jgi:superfamily II DNA/RNA helicase
VQAVEQRRILDSRRNLIVSAPTNSGKSLVGLLVLLDAVRRGRRAILLEPLRAIAREKHEELQTLSEPLAKAIGARFEVCLSTGDYRLDDERLSAPPPDHGELIIATPERVDAVLRNPDYDVWIDSVGAVCVDEAHLLSAPKRGITLEYVLTSFLCRPAPPRMILLSATLGETERLASWLAPCDTVVVKQRTPPLGKEVIALEDGEDANQVLAELTGHILSDPAAQLLVFVYQTASAEHVARALTVHLGDLAGSEGALAFHSQMSPDHRRAIRESFQAARSRCLVATTALGLGVNLPASHVIVRDTTFAGVGPLPVADLLQMMGRAGRGETPGHAIALVRPGDAWRPDELGEALKAETLPPLASALDRLIQGPRHRAKIEDVAGSVAPWVASYLARYPEAGVPVQQLTDFASRSLAGSPLAACVPDALAWLADPFRLLAYQDEQAQYHLTALGMKACRAVLPLALASGFGQLIRDILTVDPADRLLQDWRAMDHLTVLGLLYERPPRLRSFSAKFADQVDAWMEQHPDTVPIVYREWIAGQAEASRAAEVIGSLGILLPPDNRGSADWARRTAYLAVFNAILLNERGQGAMIPDLERRWQARNLEGIEERWRDDCLWLLCGITQLCDLRCFYFHLRETCGADAARIQRVKALLGRMKLQALELQEELKFCSPLGPMLRSLRRLPRNMGQASVGVGTIRKLEESGVRSLTALAGLQIDDLVELGVRRDLAKQIYKYVLKRLQ